MTLRIILLNVLTLAILSSGLCASAEDGSISTPTVGGTCAYKQYEGRAQITAINQRSYPNNDSYKVKFLFYPTRKVVETFAQIEGRELLLLTRRGAYPRMAFLEKNGIEVGKDFDCILNVIVKGTCTPTIFEFPSFRD